MTVASTRVPTREEAIEAAAEIYLEAKLRIETERAIAALQQENAPGAEQGVEGEEQNPERN